MRKNFIKRIFVPDEQRKLTTLTSNLYYDVLYLYDNKIAGHLNSCHTMTWYFDDYTGIDVVFANMNSQFAQVVFLTGMNSKSFLTRASSLLRNLKQKRAFRYVIHMV